MELSFEKWENGKWYVVLPDYDGDQEDLEMVDGADKFLDVLTTDGVGKARTVMEVSDVRDIPNNTGKKQNEYNFGKGTPDIKSYYNTLDDEPGAGPFAYIPININRNYV